MGARPLSRVIQREVRDRVTDEILFGKMECRRDRDDWRGRRRSEFEYQGIGLGIMSVIIASLLRFARN